MAYNGLMHLQATYQKLYKQKKLANNAIASVAEGWKRKEVNRVKKRTEVNRVKKPRSSSSGTRLIKSNGVFGKLFG